MRGLLSWIRPQLAKFTKSRHQPKSRWLQRSFTPKIEQLEELTMPAVDITAFNLTAGTVTFTGDLNSSTADSLVLSEVDAGGGVFHLAHNLDGVGAGDYASADDVDPSAGVAYLVIGSGTTPNITVNLLTDSDSLTVDSTWTFHHVITVDGGTGTNTLTGPNVDSDWNLTDVSAGDMTLNDAPTHVGTTAVHFSNFQTMQGGSGSDTFYIDVPSTADLIGGAGDDSFVFADAATLTGTIDGEGGSDTLDVSAYTTQAVVVLIGADGTGFNGTDGVSGGFSGIDAVVAGTSSGDDTLTGEAAASTWTLDDLSTYFDGTHSLVFEGFQTLQGGSLADVFNIHADAMANLFGGGGADSFVFSDAVILDGNIDGQGGSDTVSLAAYTSPLSISLTSSDANGFAGADGVSNSFSGIDVIVGGTDDDTLAGYDTASTWTIDSTQTYLAATHTLTFSAFESLQGGTTSDSFVFADAAAWSGFIDGNGGSDTLNLSAYTTAITVALDNSDTTGFSGGVAGVLGGFSGLGTIVGAGTSTLNGKDADATWSLDATPTYDDGTATLSFSGFGTLQGGSAADTFDILANTTATLKGGGGDDTFQFGTDNVALTGSIIGQGDSNTLSYAGYSTTAVTVTLTGSSAILGFAGTATNVSGTFSNISAVVGGSGSADTLVGRNTVSTWSLDVSQSYSDGAATLALSDFDTLQGGSLSDVFNISVSSSTNLKGGSGNDRFNFTVDSVTAGTLEGEGGSDTLNYGAFSTAVVVNLGSGATGMENIVGGSGTDTLVGADVSNSWSITANNAGKVGIVNFSSFENVTGGSDVDVFVLNNGKGVSGALSGGSGGTDTLSFVKFIGAVTVTTTGTNAGTVSGGVSFSFSSIENLTGGMGNDVVNVSAGNAFTGTVSGGLGKDTLSFAGFSNAVTANVTANNAGSIASSGVSFNFTAMESWTGGSGADVVVFSAGKGFTGTVNGGSGSDQLDFSAYTTGMKASVTANNGGKIAGVGVGFTFSAMENWTGGSGNDAVVFANGRGMSGLLDGDDGTDKLDYSAYLTGVFVNLLTTPEATGVGSIGNFENLSGGRNRDVLIGDDGANALVGNGGNDVLVGNGGNDRLLGGVGRDILLGGTGADILNGGPGDDLLVASASDHDNTVASLNFLMAEWGRTDLGYGARLKHLNGTVGSGRNGSILLTTGTIDNDFAVDTLTGGTGNDWFLSNTGDKVTDKAKAENRTGV